MSRMVLRWYLVTRLLSGHTSTTYLRWTVARLSEVTAYPWLSHLMYPARPLELLWLMQSLGMSFSELLVSQAPNIVSQSLLYKLDKATSALAGFPAGPLSWSNWNLEMLVFAEGGKPENPEKKPRSKARTNNKFNPLMAPGRNQIRTRLVGGECSHHYAIPAPIQFSIQSLFLLYG